jgi:hypothetical protein
VIAAHRTPVEERRPGWILELPPDERWRLRQRQAWEWALYRRSAGFGWFLPACREDAHRAVLRLVRSVPSAWARLRAALEAAGLIRPRREHGPPALGGVVVLCHPRTGPPAAWPASEAPVISP